MKNTTKFLAGMLLASAVFAGSGLRATADNKGLIDFRYLGNDGAATYLSVLAGPDLEGTPVGIRFGGAPYEGRPIGMAVLHGGQNVVVVPFMGAPGWYTAVSRTGTASTFDETDPGWN